MRFCSHPSQWAAVRTHLASISVPPQKPLLFFSRAMWGIEWAGTSFPPIISEPSPGALFDVKAHIWQMIQTELNCNEWKLLYLMDLEVEFDWHKYIYVNIMFLNISKKAQMKIDSERFCGLFLTWLDHREEQHTENRENENPGDGHVFWSLLLTKVWSPPRRARFMSSRGCGLTSEEMWVSKARPGCNGFSSFTGHQEHFDDLMTFFLYVCLCSFLTCGLLWSSLQAALNDWKWLDD